MPVLLLASTGGHLAQLHQLRRRLVPSWEPVVWCTFDSPQSRSLLQDEIVEFVPYVAPRDWRNIAGNAHHAHRVLQRHRPERLITTGSGIALSFLPLARARGVDCHYVESAARSVGPSLTGRIAATIPGVRTSTQYDFWASPRWQRSVSVFDDFSAEPDAAALQDLRRVVVTLGTIEGFGFRRLLERLVAILPSTAQVLWQTGETDVRGLPFDPTPIMPQAALLEGVRRADVVVAHAGIGSALGALQQGKVPVLVPRRAKFAEHVDDHQLQIARELASRGLAIHREVHELELDDLLDAARRRARPV